MDDCGVQYASREAIMNLKRIRLGCALIFGLTGLVSIAFAQGGRPDFTVKNIRRQQIEAPNYAASGSSADLGGRPSTLWRQWHKIEVQFQSEPQWAEIGRASCRERGELRGVGVW